MSEILEREQFYPWQHAQDDSLAVLDEVPDSIRKQSYLLNKRQPCRDWFPEGVQFAMAERGGIRLADSIPNNTLLLIVSGKLKGLLESEASCEIEFLPISILDHEKVPVQDDYYIANVLYSIQCMDVEASDFVQSAMDESQVHHIKQLVLDHQKIPEQTNVFRLGEELDTILVRGDLANRITATGCSGMHFINLADYGKQYRTVDRAEWIRQQLGR